MKTINIILLVIPILMFGCEPEIIEPYQTYIIKKGEHWSTYKQSSLHTETLNFSVIFDETAIYQCKTEENQYDTNKLLGFSGCNSFHHDNSARFGWRWVDDQLNISAYCYIDGERIVKPIGSVPLNEPVNYKLTATKEKYIFELEGFDKMEIKRGGDCNIGLYYMLYPYFGGDETAPHDINIKINIKY